MLDAVSHQQDEARSLLFARRVVRFLTEPKILIDEEDQVSLFFLGSVIDCLSMRRKCKFENPQPNMGSACKPPMLSDLIG
jgi:hypothetical protein